MVSENSSLINLLLVSMCISEVIKMSIIKMSKYQLYIKLLFLVLLIEIFIFKEGRSSIYQKNVNTNKYIKFIYLYII